MRATAAAASIHSDVPFQQVVEQLGLDRALARFAVASVDQPALSFPADLTAGLIERDDELCVVVDYRAEKFDAVTAQGVAGQLARVLEIVAADPAVPLGRIDILTANERVRLLIEWNDTDRDVIPATFPELFEAQVARTPDAPALLFDGDVPELRRPGRAGQPVGHLLIAGGAGPETDRGAGVAAFGGHRRRSARRAEGGRGLPAVGPGVSGGADRVHARPTPAPCRC